MDILDHLNYKTGFSHFTLFGFIHIPDVLIDSLDAVSDSETLQSEERVSFDWE